MSELQSPNDKINEIKKKMEDKKNDASVMERIKSRFDKKIDKLKEDDPNVYPMF